ALPVNDPTPFYVITPTTVGYGGVVATDTGVVLVTSTDGSTVVHEVTGAQTANPIGAPMWGPITGFTARTIGFAGGKIYLAGYYGDGTNSTRAFLWGMDNRDRSPL